MSDILRLKQPSRICAALAALCYLWLGIVVSFQHTHGMEESGETRSVTVASAFSSPQKQTSAPGFAKQTRIDVAHCIACEWQTLNASPAIPAKRWTFTPSFAPRALTTFPRYLPLPSFAADSRGPPTV